MEKFVDYLIQSSPFGLKIGYFHLYLFPYFLNSSEWTYMYFFLTEKKLWKLIRCSGKNDLQTEEKKLEAK